MKNPYNVNKGDLIDVLAVEFKKIPELSPPTWADFVKTGCAKEKQPILSDWWYHRAASILVAVESLGPIGVQKLRTKYGSNKNRGHKPEEFRKSGGSIIRKILQSLELAELVEKAERGVHKGKITTKNGSEMIRNLSKSILKDKKQ